MDQLPTAMMGFGLGLLTASLATAAIVGVSSSAALAQDASPSVPQPTPQTLKVYPSLDAYGEGRCPETVTVITTARPYREGGYSASGLAQLFKIAGPAQFEASDRFSATWRARLKPQYRSCIGTAGLADENDAPGLSFTRMRFENGYAYFILDMTGFPDVNGFSLNILIQNIEAGNPVWRWGGTD